MVKGPPSLSHSCRYIFASSFNNIFTQWMLTTPHIKHIFRPHRHKLSKCFRSTFTNARVYMDERTSRRAVSIESPIDKIFPRSSLFPYVLVTWVGIYRKSIVAKHIHGFCSCFMYMYAVADSVSNQQRHNIYHIIYSVHKSLHINIIHSYIAESYIFSYNICI